jgi:uracil-DNA glycosylase family 4
VNPLELLQQEIVACTRCSRLIGHCTTVAREKRRAYREWTYWGKPVPSFGDPRARLLILGLAPGAHGANRTGRVFTGDRSGDFLYRALFETGFASQPESKSLDDGLLLKDAWVSASVRCAPPDNKPSVEEILSCRVFLERELRLLKNVRVVVALGRIAFDNYLALKKGQGIIGSRSSFPFAHNREHELNPGEPLLLSSYHPSQQNTSTGKLTAAMLRQVFARSRKRIQDSVEMAKRGSR